MEPATAADADYVIEAFTMALDPFYGGCHETHARRVLATHLAGGVDSRGGLSIRQLLLILWQGELRRGLLNLVFKRQGTCKISPLLLYPDADASRGLGEFLVGVAQDEATRARARQLYCTVTETNHDALRFFQQSGFSACGKADDQYKRGRTEVPLVRPLVPEGNQFDHESIISVCELDNAGEWGPVRDLLLRGMNPRVDGVDGAWLDNMRAVGGPIFCARDRGGAFRAAAAATRKKGDAVKVMPVAALDDDAFGALMFDLPSLLEDRGRKAFLHMSPTAGQVAILLRSGWTLEAQIPDAYSSGQVTQQWGHPLGEDAPVKSLRIRREYLDMIKSGRKTLEIRVGYRHIKTITPGTRVEFVTGREQFVRGVAAVRRYDSFVEMLASEDVEKALPGTDVTEALSLLRGIYPPRKESLGVVVLELQAEAVEGGADDRASEGDRHGLPE